jgi:hypothetical protein
MFGLILLFSKKEFYTISPKPEELQEKFEIASYG